MHCCIGKIIARFIKNECDFLINKPSMLKCLSPSKPTRKKKKKWDDMKANKQR